MFDISSLGIFIYMVQLTVYCPNFSTDRMYIKMAMYHCVGYNMEHGFNFFTGSKIQASGNLHENQIFEHRFKGILDIWRKYKQKSTKHKKSAGSVMANLKMWHF